MNQQLAALTIAILSALTSFSALADDNGAYLGLTVAKPGHIHGVSRTGTVIESDHSGFAGRLYGGYRFNRHLALEAGYGSYGTFTLHNFGPGTSGDGKVKPSSVYAGVKGIYPVNDKFELFGKLNLVHTRFDVSGIGADDVSINRIMPGIGAEYRVSPKLGLTLEVTRYGNATIPRNGRLNLNRIEAGVNLRF